jgi:hypothetical protein
MNLIQACRGDFSIDEISPRQALDVFLLVCGSGHSAFCPLKSGLIASVEIRITAPYLFQTYSFWRFCSAVIGREPLPG